MNPVGLAMLHLECAVDENADTEITEVTEITEGRKGRKRRDVAGWPERLASFLVILSLFSLIFSVISSSLRDLRVLFPVSSSLG
jgi:hypothetical protein